VISRSNWAKDRSTLRVNRPIEVVVLNCWVTETNQTPWASNNSTSLAKSAILRSWSLVKMGTTANQKKVFFNLRKAQSKISILDDGDMRLDQVKIIARRIGVTETDVIYMNRRLGGDASLNAAIRDSGEWQDRLVDESPDQETTLAASEVFDNRRKTLSSALTAQQARAAHLRNASARRCSNRSNAISRWDDEGGASSAGDRSVRIHFSGIEQPVKGAVAPTHISRIRTSRERADSQSGVASCVRKGGRATTERPMPQIKPMSAKRALRRRWPDVLLRLPLENLRMYGERKE
jgi:hypothetical protein